MCPRVEEIHVGHTDTSDVKSHCGNIGRIAIILFLNKCAVFETLLLGVLEVTFFCLRLHSQFMLFFLNFLRRVNLTSVLVFVLFVLCFLFVLLFCSSEICEYSLVPLKSQCARFFNGLRLAVTVFTVACLTALKFISAT